MMNHYLTIPQPPQSSPIPLPIVYVKDKPVWQYKEVVRDLIKEKTPTEDELNALGAEGWELAGVFSDAMLVHFYFKRLAD